MIRGTIFYPGFSICFLSKFTFLNSNCTSRNYKKHKHSLPRIICYIKMSALLLKKLPCEHIIYEYLFTEFVV